MVLTWPLCCKQDVDTRCVRCVDDGFILARLDFAQGAAPMLGGGATAPGLAGGTMYVDVNSVSPRTKQEAAEILLAREPAHRGQQGIRRRGRNHRG